MKAQNSPEELAAVKHAAENLANLAARWAKRKESASTIQLEVRHGLNNIPPLNVCVKDKAKWL